MKKSQKLLIFIFITIVLSFALLGAKIIDIHYSKLELISAIMKLVAIGMLVFYVLKSRVKIAEGTKLVYFLLALIPLVFSFVLFMGWPDCQQYFEVAIFGIVNVVLTSIVQELFFRVYAQNLFSENGKIALKEIFEINLIYALSFAVNFFVYDYKLVIFGMIFLFAFGLFLSGLYLKTKNVFVTILSSVSYFGVRWFFFSYSSAPKAISNVLFLVIVLIFIAILTMLGLIMCKSETKTKEADNLKK